MQPPGYNSIFLNRNHFLLNSPLISISLPSTLIERGGGFVPPPTRPLSESNGRSIINRSCADSIGNLRIFLYSHFYIHWEIKFDNFPLVLIRSSSPEDKESASSAVSLVVDRETSRNKIRFMVGIPSLSLPPSSASSSANKRAELGNLTAPPIELKSNKNFSPKRGRPVGVTFDRFEYICN